jgi:hypothetical protein
MRAIVHKFGCETENRDAGLCFTGERGRQSGGVDSRQIQTAAAPLGHLHRSVPVGHANSNF